MFTFKSSPPPAADTVSQFEAMRKRARHRLIGATVLVIVGVIGFPLVFQTQPRPVPVDVNIVIPNPDKVAPLPAPVAVDRPSAVPAAEAPVGNKSTESAPSSAAVAPSTHLPVAQAEPLEEEVARVVAANLSKAEVKPEATAADKPVAKPEADPSAQRLVVQVGAYAESKRAQEVRNRLERAGLKTYTHVAKTAEGDRIRVRVGPFPTRKEAESALAKIKLLDLPAVILTL